MTQGQEIEKPIKHRHLLCLSRTPKNLDPARDLLGSRLRSIHETDIVDKKGPRHHHVVHCQKILFCQNGQKNHSAKSSLEVQRVSVAACKGLDRRNKTLELPPYWWYSALKSGQQENVTRRQKFLTYGSLCDWRAWCPKTSLQSAIYCLVASLDEKSLFQRKHARNTEILRSIAWRMKVTNVVLGQDVIGRKCCRVDV